VQLKRNAVVSSKVRNRSLRAFDFALGQIPPGPQGSQGPAGTPGTPGAPGQAGPARTDDQIAGSQCDPISMTHVVCNTVSLTLPAAGRVLLVTDAGWFSTTTASEGSCQLRVDGADVTGEAETGETAINTNGNRLNYLGLNFVTASLTAGAHTFALACKEVVANITFEDSSLSATYVGNT
jgi:hypothetical protein